MAHEINKRSDGLYACAYVGDQPWHASATKPAMFPAGTPARELTEAAGMHEYSVKRAKVRYPESAADAGNPAVWRTMDDRLVLVHSQTGDAMGIVSPQYNPVQPRAFADMVGRIAAVTGGQCVAAFQTFSGVGLNACVQIGGALEVVRGDSILPYLAAHVINDGGTPFSLFDVAFRPECNNMMRMALSDSRGRGPRPLAMTMNHKLEFDPAAIADHVERALTAHRTQVESFRVLAQYGVNAKAADRMIFDLLNGKRAPGKQQRADAPVGPGERDIRNSTPYQTILALFSGTGRGANRPGVRGTAWGLLNAVTEYADHHATAKSASHRFESAIAGNGSALKDAAFAQFLATATGETADA